jgi:hypothetical protein
MPHHRFQEPFDFYRLPQPAVQAPTSGSFVACPAALVQGLSPTQQLWQCSLYQLAFEQAQAMARPSLVERDLLGVWN